MSLSAVPAGASPEASLANPLDLDAALEGLAAEHPRPARVVELRAFGGLTIEETAECLDASHATLEDDMRAVPTEPPLRRADGSPGPFRRRLAQRRDPLAS